MLTLPIVPDLSDPLVTPAGFRNPPMARSRTEDASIFSVSLRVYGPKVEDPIVAPVAVNMVNKASGPISVGADPSRSVRKDLRAFKVAVQVASRRQARKCWSVGKTGVPRVTVPAAREVTGRATPKPEKTGLGVEANAITQPFRAHPQHVSAPDEGLDDGETL